LSGKVSKNRMKGENYEIVVLKLVFYFLIVLVGVFLTVIALGNYLYGKLLVFERFIIFIGAGFSILSIILSPWFSIITLFIVIYEFFEIRKRSCCA